MSEKQPVETKYQTMENRYGTLAKYDPQMSGAFSANVQLLSVDENLAVPVAKSLAELADALK